MLVEAGEQIIEQGEGARGDWRDAHYGRFLGIWEEFQALRLQDPEFDPARPVVPAFTRQPFDVAAPHHAPGRTVVSRCHGRIPVRDVLRDDERRAAWTVLHERIALLASSCAELAASDGAPAGVREAGEKAAAIAGELDAERQGF